ncbi:hypothetical protein V9J15_02075 [Candidatus Liberibacter africanus]|uniref:hypothetical protein n=1 Tax=Liberibacter africanus TaxID=34020 RepID=UPI00339D3792
MDMELQEQFRDYVLEDVKAHLGWWYETWFDYEPRTAKVEKRTFSDRITELRRVFAKENGLKSVTPICPKPRDLVDTVARFMNGYIASERSRIAEEFKPLAVSKVLNDEVLLDRMNAELVKGFVAYGDGSRNYHGDILYDPYWELRHYLDDYYKEIKHTLGYSEIKHKLGNKAYAVDPCVYTLANEIFRTFFNLQVVLNPDSTEQIKNVA